MTNDRKNIELECQRYKETNLRRAVDYYTATANHQPAILHDCPVIGHCPRDQVLSAKRQPVMLRN